MPATAEFWISATIRQSARTWHDDCDPDLASEVHPHYRCNHETFCLRLPECRQHPDRPRHAATGRTGAVLHQQPGPQAPVHLLWCTAMRPRGEPAECDLLGQRLGIAAQP